MKTILQAGRQGGVAAVELALILPIMLVLVFGITEIGRALYQYDGLVKATRGAVRYLAQQDLANLSSENRALVYNKTKALAVCGKEDCSGQAPLVTGLSTSFVNVCDYITCEATHKGVQTGEGSVDMATATIEGFTFKTMVPWVIKDISFAPIKTTMTARYN
jgi:Flp pilus assembly protein TadG